MSIEVNNITKIFNKKKVLNNVSLSVNDGEIVVILGSSGCGKTTLLRTIAGLEDPNEGSIIINGIDQINIPSHKRDVSLIFQKPVLLQHLTVKENLAYPLLCKNGLSGILWRRNKVINDNKELILKIAEKVKIDPLLERKGEGLSGGELARVEIGRALLKGSSVGLFDEPLGNVDVHLRVALRKLIANLLEEKNSAFKSGMLFVTHDHEDAVFLADRVAIMKDGSILQVGKYHELKRRPESIFVATFLNPIINLLKVECKRLQDNLVSFSWSNTSFNLYLKRNEIIIPENVIIGINPNDIKLKLSTSENSSSIKALLLWERYIGIDQKKYMCLLIDKQELIVCIDTNNKELENVPINSEVYIEIVEISFLTIFDIKTEKVIEFIEK